VKALVYTGTRRIEMQNLPEPCLGPQDAIVAVGAVGICGSELEAYLGMSRKRVPPLVMGHEFAGTIYALGESVKGFAIGEKVVVQPLLNCGSCPECISGRTNICRNRKLLSIELPGGYAECAAVPASALFRLPSGVPFEIGSLAEPLANAVHILERAKYRVLGKLVILGGGTIGALVLMLARAIGIEHIALVEPNEWRRAKLASLGSEIAVDPRDANSLRTVVEWSGGGADVVVDASGAAQARKFAVECAAPNGTVVLVGQGSPSSDADHRDILTKELNIRGSYAYTNDDFLRAIELLRMRRVDPEGILRTVPMSDGPNVFADLASGNAGDIKVVMIPAGR